MWKNLLKYELGLIGPTHPKCVHQTFTLYCQNVDLVWIDFFDDLEATLSLRQWNPGTNIEKVEAVVPGKITLKVTDNFESHTIWNHRF